jgi:DNA-binding MarR family transcriptional regulator
MSERMKTHQRTGYLVRRAQAAVHAELEQRLIDHDLSFTQWGVLAALMDFPGMSNADLARFAFMTPQSMNPAVKQLEAAGLVERRPNSANGRILDARLTEQGKNMVRTMDRHVARIEERMLRGLSPAERRALDNALTVIADNLN